MLYVLKLYVAGRSQYSQHAIERVEEICRTHLSNAYELEVIDVLERPELAETEKIVATPTLVRELPPPLRKIVGDLSEGDKVLLGLDLVEINTSTGETNA